MLTPQGIKEKTRLTFEFLDYSYQYIHQVRNRVRDELQVMLDQGKTRVVFFGSGEVAELAYLAVRELKMELVAVLDPARVGHKCVDHLIEDRDWFDRNAEFDILLLFQPLGRKEKAEILSRIDETHQTEIISIV